MRGAGCIKKSIYVLSQGQAVVVPVRGTGCILLIVVVPLSRQLVVVPVRGTGCICKRIQTRISIFVGSSQPVSVV